MFMEYHKEDISRKKSKFDVEKYLEPSKNRS